MDEQTQQLDVLAIQLDSGSHSSPAVGMCVMELASYLAHEPFSDHPQCASPVIAAFLRSWNDTLDDESRQQLKPYAEKVIGTRGTPEQEHLRSLMALDWQIRVYLPTWLRMPGKPALNEHADIFAGLAPLTHPFTDFAAIGALVRAAYAAAYAAASDAAYAAAGDAAGDAAYDAAGAAAYDAAGAAAGAAAYTAAYDAAYDAAYAAAGAAAYAAAYAAASDALQPTVKQLQASAHELLDAMITVTY